METSSRAGLYVRCFLVGGIYGVLGQVIGTVVTPLTGPMFAGPVTLLLLGVVALIMYIPGVHQKIAAKSGFGSILPFNGFACGIADAYQGGYRASGTGSGAFKSVFGLFKSVVIYGGLACMAVGVLGSFVDFPKIPVPAAPSLTLSFVFAFIVAGVMCLLFQAITDAGGFAIPKVLMVGLSLGGICTLFGITDWLATIGGYGFTILVVGAGQAVTATTIAALGGQPLMLFVVWGVFAALAVIGTICGVGNRKFGGEDGGK